jgi:hypothetical protein
MLVKLTPPSKRGGDEVKLVILTKVMREAAK